MNIKRILVAGFQDLNLWSLVDIIQNNNIKTKANLATDRERCRESNVRLSDWETD